MPYCPNCGTQNSDISKFCTSCGTALPGITAEQKPIPQFTPSPAPVQPGSRVTFVAADGKTYTGIIREVQGDQYKIKYEHHNYEVWMRRNMFTVITGNTPPAYSNIPQNINPHQQTYAGSSSSFITSLGFWGSIIIIIGFFTNWLSIGFGYGFGIGVSGFRLMTGVGEVLNNTGSNDTIGITIVVCMAAIIISAFICLLYTIGVGLGKSVFFIFKILPLIALVTWLVVIISNSYGAFESGDLFKVFGLGVYLTLLGSILLLVSRSRK